MRENSVTQMHALSVGGKIVHRNIWEALKKPRSLGKNVFIAMIFFSYSKFNSYQQPTLFLIAFILRRREKCFFTRTQFLSVSNKV